MKNGRSRWSIDRLGKTERDITMPKLKTRKCAAKRLKETGTGKFRHHKAGARHLKSSKNAKRKRRLRQDGAISHAEAGRIKTALPYGL